MINEEREVCLRKYYWNTKIWDKEIQRRNIEYNIVNMNFIVDREEDFHICYCGEKDGKYFVVAKEDVLMSDLIKPTVPLLSYLNDELICMFNYYGKLLKSAFINGKFQKLTYFHINGFKECSEIKLSSSAEVFEQRNFTYTYAYRNKENIFCDATVREENYKNTILQTNAQRKETDIEMFAEKNK